MIVPMSINITTPYSIRLGVAGSGAMGSGIALAALFKNMVVTLYDISPAMLDQARNYIEKHLDRKGKRVSLNNLTLTTDLEALAGCGVIVEAVLEKLELKQDLFARLDALCPPPAILATNTSTLSVTAIASAAQHPERVAGMHFFNPAPVLPLVEIVRAARTNQATIDSLVALAQLLDKTPVIAGDTPGFIVNRVARPFYGEALRLAGEGIATHEQIDRLVRMAGGFRMGPFQLMDLIGIDVNFTAMQSMYEQTFGEPRYRPHPIQVQMVSQRALGRKTGQGFYSYANGEEIADPKPPRPSPADGKILFSPGSWAPDLEASLESAGYTLLSSASLATGDLAAGFVVAGRGEGLAEQVRLVDIALPPNRPLFVQAAGVTLAEAGQWSKHPERLVGFDGLFFAGSRALNLVAYPGEPNPDAVESAGRLVSGLGRLPVWTGDGPALVLPRILAMLANEAAFAVGEGVAGADTIDTAMKLGVNYPFGPLEWARKTGWEKVVTVLDHLYQEYHEDRYRTAPLLRRWARIFYNKETRT